MEYSCSCIKFNLPNGETVDILSNVLQDMAEWIQDEKAKPESCGFILGYENNVTHNITLSEITFPQANDRRNRFFCQIVDRHHFEFLQKNKIKHNYYMGVWHTHPQKIPTPSHIDWKSWNDILKKDKTGCNYAFFVILGETEFRIWAGDFATKAISEIFEVNKQDGIYMKG